MRSWVNMRIFIINIWFTGCYNIAKWIRLPSCVKKKYPKKGMSNKIFVENIYPKNGKNIFKKASFLKNINKNNECLPARRLTKNLWTRSSADRSRRSSSKLPAVRRRLRAPTESRCSYCRSKRANPKKKDQTETRSGRWTPAGRV